MSFVFVVQLSAGRSTVGVVNAIQLFGAPPQVVCFGSAVSSVFYSRGQDVQPEEFHVDQTYDEKTEKMYE